jgi:hypothetical protein
MGFLILAVLLGLIPAAIARGKGRDFAIWWFYGAALFIVVLPHELMLSPAGSPGGYLVSSVGSAGVLLCAQRIMNRPDEGEFMMIQTSVVEESADVPSSTPKPTVALNVPASARCGVRSSSAPASPARRTA